MAAEWLKKVDWNAVREAARERQDERGVRATIEQQSRQLARERPLVEAQGLEVEGPQTSGRVEFRFSTDPDEVSPDSELENANVNGWFLAEPHWVVKTAPDGRVFVQLAGVVTSDQRAMLTSGIVDLKISFRDGGASRQVHAFTVRGMK